LPSEAARCGYWYCETPNGFVIDHEVLCFDHANGEKPRRLSVGEEQQAKKVKSPKRWEKMISSVWHAIGLGLVVAKLDEIGRATTTG
jgi:hypothetical protein